MKIKQNIVARDSQGNEYSTMEEIFGFRTSYRLYIICAESSALIGYDEDEGITDCYYDGLGFRMPDFTLSISQFMEDLRNQDVLAGDEIVTHVYTEDQISIEIKVRDDE